MAETKQEIPHLREIDFSEIEDFSIVGRGSFGTVYKARWQNQFVAIKGFEFEADPKAIETEVKQLSRVIHPNIIVFYGISLDNSRIYLVMEYAEGGSLHSFLHGKARPYYSAAHAMSWACQCAEGVAYLHGMRPKPLIHRDLKPLNLLLVNKGRNLKICDFGTVADKSTLMTNNKGSAAWMAPEVFRGSSYTEKCDVFSWAIILWQIITREQPYKDFGLAYSIMWHVNQGHRPPLIEGCPRPIENLMTSCWDQDPEKRPSMAHVVKVMKTFCAYFPGADEPLDYESPHEQHENKLQEEQQLFESSSSASSDVIASNKIPLENLSSNNSSSITPTNSGQITQINQEESIKNNSSTSSSSSISEANLKSSIFKGDELQTLPEEIETKWIIQQRSNNNGEDDDDEMNDDNDNKMKSTINTSNQQMMMNAVNRTNEIRNGMLKNQHLPMQPLSVQVDPNAWELKRDYRKILENISKSEGKERLTVTEKKSDILDDTTTTTTTNATQIGGVGGGGGGVGVADDTEKSLHLMLDPELQPEAPDPNSQVSQEIFEEHQKLAKEYLRVDTELYYATDRKEKLLATMDPDEKQEKLTIIKKLMEKEELLGLYNDLQKQLEQIKAAQGIINATNNTVVQQQQDQQQQTPTSQTTTTNLKSASPEEPPDQEKDGWVFIPSNANQS